jgi:hypothetical protein
VNARHSAQLLRAALAVGREDLARDGHVRQATWDVIDAAMDQLDQALAELERLERPRLSRTP